MRCLLILVLLLAAPAAHALCRQALVLALDVSGSVNDREYAQQVRGLSRALASDDVAALLLSDPASHVEIAVFEWSSENHQVLLADWTAVTDRAALDRLAAIVAAHRKQRQGLKTAMGRAMQYAAALMAQRPACLKRTIDVAGDGYNNVGPTPREVYGAHGFSGITVNALIVGDPAKGGAVITGPAARRSELQRYYEDSVLHGPGAFSEIAFGFVDYERAMRRKLERELAPALFGYACVAGCPAPGPG